MSYIKLVKHFTKVIIDLLELLSLVWNYPSSNITSPICTNLLTYKRFVQFLCEKGKILLMIVVSEEYVKHSKLNINWIDTWPWNNLDRIMIMLEMVQILT